MSFPRYPKYKPSGVEWLGEVPEHWMRTRLKRVVSVCGRIGFRGYTTGDLVNEGAGALALGGANLTDLGKLDLSKRTFISWPKYEESPEIQVSVNDLVIGQRGTCGKVVVVDSDIGPATINPSLVLLKQPRVDSRYLCYWLMGRLIQSIFDSYLNATAVPMLSQEQIGNVLVCHPPILEQRAIAVFLDRETSKIDWLVSEQRRLIELLNEKIISLVLSSFHAAETTELRLSEASTIISRPVIQKVDESYTRIGLFNRGRGLFHKDASEMDDMGESDFFWVEEGDLIISGQFAWEGAVALADKEDEGCVVSHRYPVIRGKDGVALTEYLLGLLCTKHGDYLLNENSRGAAGRNRPLNISSLMKEKIPVPNMGVQEAVARAVHARKALFKEIAKAIELLQERRTALISAAVTGQIDVRGLVAA